METLTAFVREPARWKEPKAPASDPIARLYEDTTSERRSDGEPPTDIATVLAVICRRDEANRKREGEQGWRLDVQGTDLRKANLRGEHLERGAHLEGAFLWDAHLEGTDLRRVATGLVDAQLMDAHGDAKTWLPEGIQRPAHWPPEEP